MKRVKVLFEALVEDDQLKSEEELKEEDYIDYEDAAAMGGLNEIVKGSYEYNVSVFVFDEED